MTTSRTPVVLWLLPALLAAGAAGGDPPERLPEPAHEFARAAARALADQERAWLARAEELDVLRGPQEDTWVPGRPLAAESAALLARSRAVLASYREVDRELGRFRSALGQAAAHYRAVAELYAADGGRARSVPTREDFRALAAAYTRQAAAVEARAGRVGLPPGSAGRAAELEEGNHFLERLAEAAAAVPLGREDELLLADRLRQHAERCGTLAAELASAVKAVLSGSDAALRPRTDPHPAEITPSPATLPTAASPPPRPAKVSPSATPARPGSGRRWSPARPSCPSATNSPASGPAPGGWARCGSRPTAPTPASSSSAPLAGRACKTATPRGGEVVEPPDPFPEPDSGRGKFRMSHIVTIATKVRDPAAVAAACTRLGLPAPEHGTAKLYGGEATGLLVQLPGWVYPAVVDLASGEVRFDDYGGRWGERSHLDRFLQLYAVERAKQEARKHGYAVTEQALEGGSIRLHIAAGD